MSTQFHLTPEEILRDWHLLGALWLLEDPAFTYHHAAALKHAVLISTEKDIEFLREMASVPNPEVRSQVARDLNTPHELLWKIAHDPDGNVRAALASNFHAPLPLLQRLTIDPSSWVRYVAEPTVNKRIERHPKAPAMPPDFDTDWHNTVRFFDPYKNLTQLIESPDWHWLAALPFTHAVSVSASCYDPYVDILVERWLAHPLPDLWVFLAKSDVLNISIAEVLLDRILYQGHLDARAMSNLRSSLRARLDLPQSLLSRLPT